MRPMKASLFIVYCLLAVVLVGTAFSHVWRTSRLIAKNTIPTVAQEPKAPADSTASARPIEPEKSQS